MENIEFSKNRESDKKRVEAAFQVVDEFKK